MRILILIITIAIGIICAPGKNTKTLNLSFETRCMKYNSLKKTSYFPAFVYIISLGMHFPKGVWIVPPYCSLFNIWKLFKHPQMQHVRYRITFIEGMKAQEIMDIINSSSLSGPCIMQLKEGTIYPDTYFYTIFDSKEQLVKITQTKMKKELNKLWKTRPKWMQLSMDEWIILASIVQKEGINDQDFQKIASCFLLRLKKKLRLQSCVTVEYFMNKKKPLFKDLQIANEYNTYRNLGLPPTPICIPSINALQAVLNADVNFTYYYFYSCNGKTILAKTFEEHKKNKKFCKLLQKKSENKKVK